MRKLYPVTLENLPVFMKHFVDIGNKTCKFPVAVRNHILNEVDKARTYGWIKFEGSKVLMLRVDPKVKEPIKIDHKLKESQKETEEK